MTPEEAVLACPFCGGETRIAWTGEYEDLMIIRCLGATDCYMRSSGVALKANARSRMDLIAAWNRRASTSGVAIRDAANARITALQQLLACYRVGKRPTEKLFNALDKSEAAWAVV